MIDREMGEHLFLLHESVACTVYSQMSRVRGGTDTIGCSTGIIAGMSGRNRFDS